MAVTTATVVSLPLPLTTAVTATSSNATSQTVTSKQSTSSTTLNKALSSSVVSPSTTITPLTLSNSRTRSAVHCVMDMFLLEGWGWSILHNIVYNGVTGILQ